MSQENRLAEAAVAALSGAPNQMLGITHLNKVLFYLDLLWLRDHGELATGATYIALENGPVVAKYQKRLVKRLDELGWAIQTEDEWMHPVKLATPPSKLEQLPEEAAKLAAELAAAFERHTARDVSNLSHDNPGWVHAFEAGLGSRKSPRPINMVLALQQDVLLDDDEWLNQPLSEAESAAVKLVIEYNSRNASPW